MIPDLDIYRSAHLVMKRHGQDAPIHAAMRADAVNRARKANMSQSVGSPAQACVQCFDDTKARSC